jgi:hypothetical protein
MAVDVVHAHAGVAFVEIADAEGDPVARLPA